MQAMHVAVLEEHERDWVRAHEALSRLARERAAADAKEGRWLLAAFRAAAHVHMGFGAFGEYVERMFGYGRRCTQEKLRVAEALERLPALSKALEEGALSWSAVRELTRVAAPETERAWLEVAYGKTIRQLEEIVAGRREGDMPDAPPELAARRHVLRFEVAAETLASFRQALVELRRRGGGSMDDDAALLEMARCVLRGSSDEERSSYQLALTVCAACGAGSQEANGERVRFESDIVAMASCDAQRIGRVDPQPANDAPGRESIADSVGTANDTPRPRAHVYARAKQSVPPAVRRAVLRRDHGCCRVPGCRNATFLDLHHIALRSEGGAHHADNLLTVCGAHHRALHRGELRIEGTSTDAARFRHADGTPYGDVADPTALNVQTQVFGALRNLGFRESEARRAMAELRADAAHGPVNASDLLRAALQRLAKP